MTDGKGYRRQNKATHIERKRLKSPRNYTAGNGFGRSFLMSVAGRNTTSFAGNAKGAASRASVPPLSNARTIYRKGEQDNDRLSKQHSCKAGNHQGQRDHPERGAQAVDGLKPSKYLIDTAIWKRFSEIYF